MQDTLRLGAEKVEQSLREVKVVESASHALQNTSVVSEVKTYTEMEGNLPRRQFGPD